jgi:hypothetical protein
LGIGFGTNPPPAGQNIVDYETLVIPADKPGSLALPIQYKKVYEHDKAKGSGESFESIQIDYGISVIDPKGAVVVLTT